jgi:hypothetical protein
MTRLQALAATVVADCSAIPAAMAVCSLAYMHVMLATVLMTAVV